MQAEWRAKNPSRAKANNARANSKRREGLAKRKERTSACIYFGTERLKRLTRTQAAGGFTSQTETVCAAVDITAKLTRAEVARFKQLADDSGRDMAQVVADFLREWVIVNARFPKKRKGA
jgi:hypothetical protein